MEFRILGPLEVVEDGEPIDVGPRKQRSLLALLVISANRVVRTDRILEELWGDDAEGKERTLWVYISRLRSVLGGHEILVTRDHGYSLVVDPNTIDARRFETAASEGRALIKDDPTAASARLSDALGLWRGAAYEDFGDESFAQVEIARLEELRLEAMADRIDVDLKVGESSGLVSELESLVRLHPLDERFVGQLMLALHGSGRTAEALAAYERTRRTLSEELGIEPSRMLQHVEQQVLVDDESTDLVDRGAEPERVHNLPAEATSFVGRDSEVSGVMATMAETRLVTLTGIGGVGKTRIALRVAADLVGHYPNGVWIAELAPASSSAQVREVIAHALAPAIPTPRGSLDELARALASKELLLVLDNCEHVISTCAEVAQQLLESSPGLRILATSREPLEIAAETVWPVAAMTVPDPSERGLALDEMIKFDAVRLLVDRARAARPGFSLTEESTDHIARICWRVAGIPLAIELAAARLRSMTIAEIASGLDHVFELLTSRSRTGLARHQTLQATLDWSFELLDEQERLLLDRVRVFHLDFPRKAAEVICAGEGVEESEILDLLGRLVDTSWIAMESVEGEARYLMLPIVREFLYGKQKSDKEGKQEWLVERPGWVVWLAQRTDLGLKGSDREMWSVLLDGDHRTARRALDIAYDQIAIEEGAFLAGAAAALTSTTGRLGFIGGVQDAQIERFLHGFETGAHHVDPGAIVEIRYLYQAPDYTGFWDRARMRDVATELYQRGVDVAMHAAGTAGDGMSAAALQTSETTGQHKWCIGVDFDWYYDVTESESKHVLTSVRLQIPTSVYRALKEAVAAEQTDLPRFDLASNGVVLSMSGGHLDDIIDELLALRQQIIEGSIEMPTVSKAR
jgi:predicted ATPase/DNA-binding winged helix-turn-helix (wHTH) protein